MILRLNILLGILFVIIIYSCGGTHGSIKEYSFNTSEENLKKNIDELVEEKSYLSYKESDMGIDYFTLLIKDDYDYEYVCRIYGNEKEKKKMGSKIFIAYVKIGDGKLQTESNITSNDEKKIIKLFEDKFIKNLNKKKSHE